MKENRLRKKIALTGSSGLVGRALVARLNDRYDLIQLQRQSSVHSIPFTLGQSIDAKLLMGVDVLVHSAHDFAPDNEADNVRINVQGSKILIEAAVRAGVKKIIFISSVSAFEGCQTFYGRGKLEVEKIVRQHGGMSIRPGLIYSKSATGPFAKLNELAKKKFIPLFDGGRQDLSLVSLDDVVGIVSFLLEQDSWNTGGESVTLAQPHLIQMRDLMVTLAQRQGQHPIFVPVPSFLIMGGLRLLEKLKIKPPFRSDGLKGLLFTNPSFTNGIPAPLEGSGYRLQSNFMEPM